MEIAPIVGIRAVSLPGLRRVEGVWDSNLVIDAMTGAGEDAYAAGQRADRGLEDEEDVADDELEPGEVYLAHAGTRVNLMV